MERSDRKKTVYQEWEANYNARGSATLDASSTELVGSRREVDLVVRGLKALRAQVQIRDAAGLAVDTTKRYGDDTLGAAPTEGELTTLLEEIEKPNYVAEAETVTQFL